MCVGVHTKHLSLEADFKEVDRVHSFWNGEGLPPVGTVCEFFVPCDVLRNAMLWKKELEHGAKVEIIHHYDTGICPVAVFKFEVDFGHMVEQAGEGCFRPIRTTEQIEREERRAGIDQMYLDSKPEGSPPPKLHDALHALWMAGYRKQVKP